MTLSHNQKMDVIERLWKIDTCTKTLRSQLELVGMDTRTNMALGKVETQIKEVHIFLHDLLAEKPVGYIFK